MLSELLVTLFESENNPETYFIENPNMEEKLLELTQMLINNSTSERIDLIRSIFLLQDETFRNPLDKENWIHEHPTLYKIKYMLVNKWEKDWVSQSSLVIEEIPEDPKKFARWLRNYCQEHELFKHPLLTYLKEGDFEDFKGYFYYDSSFDTPQVELYARATVGLPDEAPRIEISKNYWDEMGLGVQSDCHGTWSTRFTNDINLFEEDKYWLDHFKEIPAETLEKFIVSQYVSLYRKNWLNVIGHLGATEIYDPILNVKIIQLGRNYGLSDETLEYFIQHVKVDAIHSRDWLNKVVIPLVSEDKDYRWGIARGAEMNLTAQLRSFDAVYNLLRSKSSITN